MMLSKILQLSGWRRFLGCLILGALAALGHPPFNIIFAPLVAFPLWLFLLSSAQEESWLRHFSLGWAFGLGYFTVGLYWITFSLGVDLSTFWWLIPFSLFGIPTALGVYTGGMAVLLKLSKTTGISRCCAFAFLWAMTELAWSSGPLAFPWNPLGLSWSSIDPLIQTVSLFGIDGLTLLTALFVSFPLLFLQVKIDLRDKIYTSILILIFIGLSGYGSWRQDHTPLKSSENLPLIRLVQPNIPQRMKWEPTVAREQFYDMIELSSQVHGPKPDIIVWPESALPLFLDETPFARQIIAEILPPHGYLIAGTARRAYGVADQIKVWNSLVVIDKVARVIETYDKYHLVPFGEYVPFRQVIPSAITKITAGEIDYSQGEGLETIEIKPYPPFSPLICFEAIFTAEVIAKDQMRPEWLLNITNDAWFGRSSGPYQHLQLARLRTIEEGIPLVRVANTGISTVIDSFGHEVKRLDLNTKGILDIKLPPALESPPIFPRYGMVIYVMMLVTILGLGLLSRKK